MGIWFGVFNMSPSLKTMTILLLVSPTEVVAWAGFGPRLQLQSLPLMQQSAPSSRSRSGISTSQLAAATGGGGFGSNSSAGKEIKLKPKQQWDRYTALKKESAFKVGVRIVDDSSVVNDWLDVGSIKASADIVDNGTEIAVARQRALIAEHAKRLYPLQIPPKAQVEWGYLSVNGESSGSSAYADTERIWIAVDKAVVDSAPDGVEKMIGFEGKPDPATGFYCVYNEGRLVKNTDGDLGLKPSSKKLS